MDTKSGIYGKYKIEKADGSAVDPNAVYFVLRLDKDPYALRALDHYIMDLYNDSEGDSQYARDLTDLKVILSNPLLRNKVQFQNQVREMIARPKPSE